MKTILNKIFNHPELIEHPPVLVDVGASGSLHYKWKKIARYSWCIAFDADKRDFKYTENEAGKFKKLFTYNCIVSNEDKSDSKFYLTRSPYCSSLLEPDTEKLKDQVFSDLFEVEKTVYLPTKSLSNALDELNISRIDWFKTDSQGIDLRLFKSIREEIQKKVLVAEFEPGIINSYKGEDKLFEILKFFDSKDFWLSDINIKGVARIPKKLLKEYFATSLFFKLAKESLHKAPGWGEMTFFNGFTDDEIFTIRDYMLAWVFATLEKHHAFALVLARNGLEKFKDDIFEEMERKSLSYIKRGIYKLRFLPSVFVYIKKFLF
ncbi:MAG: hypothetical protein PVF17_01220 [Ignavibacteria bacterium]|jgi:hypothetical protein